MNASDLQYLSRFALDPEIECGGEDSYGLEIADDFYRDNENILDEEDDLPEDDLFFEN